MRNTAQMMKLILGAAEKMAEYLRKVEGIGSVEM